MQFGILPLALEGGLYRLKISVRVVVVNMILAAISCGLYYAIFMLTEPAFSIKENFVTNFILRFILFHLPMLPMIGGWIVFKLKHLEPMKTQVFETVELIKTIVYFTGMYIGVVGALLTELTNDPYFLQWCLIFSAGGVMGIIDMVLMHVFFLIMLADVEDATRRVADSSHITVKKVKHLINTYGRYKEAFGLPYLMIFSMVQMFMIGSVYNAAQGFMTAEFTAENYPIFVAGFCNILSNVTVFFEVGLLIKKAELAYDSLSMPEDKILDQFLRTTKVREALELKEAMRLLDKCEKFTAMDFFTVERATLTGLVSTSITYLVVLLQSSPGTN